MLPIFIVGFTRFSLTKTIEMLFAFCSPSCTAFALRQTAKENVAGARAQVIQTVRNNFDVDDLLKSCGSLREAVVLIKQLKCLLASGGFHLTKFLFNKPDFLSSVPEGEVAVSSLDLNLHGLPTQKTLGVYWDAASDKI